MWIWRIGLAFTKILLLAAIIESHITNGQEIPGLVITPSDQNVVKFVGENYSVQCKSTSNLQTEKQWLNPRNLVISSSGRIRTEVAVGLELDLHIGSIHPDDALVYVCVDKTSRVSFNLSVVRPIVFDTSLAVQNAQEGKDFTLKCDSRGHSGRPLITWKIDDRLPEGRFKQQPDGNLRISNVNANDAQRVFQCQATDTNALLMDSKPMEIVLKIKMKPRVQSEAIQYAVLGQWANITCAASAEPAARFEWQFRNAELLTNTDTHLILNPTDNISILQKIFRNAEDFGDYTCKAINQLGLVTQTISVKRANKPSKPTLSIVHLGSTGVAIGVVYPSDPNQYHDPSDDSDQEGVADLPVIGYSVQFKMLRRENWVKAYNVTVTDYGFILRNLVPRVTYFVRAAAVNPAAEGDYSEILQLNTPARVKFEPPTSVSSSGNAEYIVPVLEGFLIVCVFILGIATGI